MIKVKIGRCHAATGIAAAICISAWTFAAICRAEERWRRKRRTRSETSGYRSETAAS